MSFKVGDVVQVINEDAFPATEDFPATPHPDYGMIGIVCDVRHSSLGRVGVFFPTGILDIDKKTGLPGRATYFAHDELALIGRAVVGFDYDRINLITQEQKEEALEKYNKRLGTSFSTVEELLDFYRTQKPKHDTGEGDAGKTLE